MINKSLSSITDSDTNIPDIAVEIFNLACIVKVPLAYAISLKLVLTNFIVDE